MIKHVSIPLPHWHWCYEPTPNELMDDTESRIIMAACAKFDMPRVLEIGTCRGGTTANLAKIVKAREGQIITVDVLQAPETLPHEQRGEVRPSSEIGSLIPENLRSVVTQVLVDPSTDYYSRLEQYAPFDVIFYDGDHSIEGVRRDLDNTQHMLSSNGIRLLHDVWWDATPPPVDGPLDAVLKSGGKIVLNFSHVGMLTEAELERLEVGYVSR